MEFLIYGLSFSAVALAARTGYDAFSREFSAYVQKRSAEAATQLGEMFMDLPRPTLRYAYALSPPACGALFWLLTGSWLLGLCGLAAGLVAPKIVIGAMGRQRQQAFHSQLVDALLIMSSSLKAGLSMMQAFSVIAEEMPPPISQEFGLLLKQVRMGVGLDEALTTMKARLPSDDLTLFVTAVLVSRETGGDVTHLFQRLVETLRERKKLKERVKTLTFMARVQGIIMAMLPFLFGTLVYHINRSYFTFFFTDPTGRLTLAAIVLFQVVGAMLFVRFARSPL